VEYSRLVLKQQDFRISSGAQTSVTECLYHYHFLQNVSGHRTERHPVQINNQYHQMHDVIYELRL